ncbi:MAG: M48 family metalloprotease [Proteobacteria bacterium]|nr:M48 family metalloprotease [Pseudomonadota bacterium]
MRFLIIGLALSLLAACAQNPVTGSNDFVMMSENQEIAVGRQNDEQVKKQYHVYGSKALQDYVNSVGQRIARQSHRPNLQYHFTVLDTPDINAFALPGGYVYITRGILAYLNSEAELAAVLGHEIGHVTARHGVRQQSAAQAANIGLTIASIFVPEINTAGGSNLANMVGGALLSGYGREHELEADKLGAEYLARTDYDPQAIITVIKVLKNQEVADEQLAKQEGREPRRYHGVFATHPDNDTRLKQAVSEAGKNESPHAHFTGHREFLAATEGMVFNDNSDQGIVRYNAFYHGELGIALQFPKTWQVHNLPTALIAVSPQGEVQMQMKLDESPNGSPAEYARNFAGYGAQITTLNVNGLPAALFDQPDAAGGVVFLNRQAFILQAKGKARGSLAALREDVIRTVKSFHAITANERQLLKPLTLHVITARTGDSFADLAKNSPLGQSAESYLRLINAQFPSGEPQAGQLIKLVR